MLRFLRITRLAIIDAVEVEFDPGFNVLTGETGAGKSILVEAVGLLLGGRASGDLVRTGEDLATIEAIFESGGKELLIRREISAQGRSRAFIDGELVTASALKDLSARLIELHGQHEHHTLLDPSMHLLVLDQFGQHHDHLTAVATAFEALRNATEELGRVQRALADRSARQELAAFQFAELDRAAIKPDEDVELTAVRQVLANAERVDRLCAESYSTLYESDDAILAALGGVWRRVADLAALDPQFKPYLEARDGIKSQLEDLALFLRRYADSIEASPARLQQVEERLALIDRLKRRHGPELAGVIAKREALRQELADLEGGDQRLTELERAHAAARTRFLSAAEVLSEARREVAPVFSQRLEQLLAELAMESTRFEVRFTDGAIPEAGWTAQGIDQAEFFVSPNPGEDLRPLARIVSGGELSRIMLAIKTLTATSRHGFSDAFDRPPGAEAPGLIFDEVDAGIGGRVADVVGGRLRALGSAFQVLCITHLPQIAAYADTHFHIEKRVESGRTTTSVVRLTPNAQVDEIARMLGGTSVTDAVKASAREMLEKRRTHGGPGQGSAQSPSRPTPKREPGAKGESERAKVARRPPERH